MTLLKVLPFIGLFLMMCVTLSFFLQKKFFGINPLLFEALGFTIVGFYCGMMNYTKVLGVIAIGCVIAILFDPYIWKKVAGMAVNAHKRKMSFFINTGMGLIFFTLFFVGKFVR